MKRRRGNKNCSFTTYLFSNTEGGLYRPFKDRPHQSKREKNSTPIQNIVYWCKKILRETADFLRHNVNIDIEETRTCWKAGHCAHRSNERVYEACANAGPDISNGQHKSRGSTLLSRDMGEGVLRFRHANG